MIVPLPASSIPEVRTGQKIADVGSGEGPFSFPLAKRTGETGAVYAVDIAVEDRKICTKKREGQCLA